MFPALNLPDLDALDPAALKAMILAQHDQYQAQQDHFKAQHERYTATLTSRASEIERLVLLVEKLQRMLFGAKSEKVLRQIEQLEFQLEDLQAASAIEEAQADAAAEPPASAKPFRRPLAEHLPREVHTHLAMRRAPTAVGACANWGEDVAEMLEYVRSSFKVLRHVRPKLSCDACDRIVQAPAPSRPIDRGLAGPGLLAHVYAIEAEIRGSTPEIRKTIRQARAKPLLDSMRTWLETTLAKLSRKSDTAAAIRYALSRWRALTRYVEDGQLEIDNNAAERALRVVALGRKNFLFAGSNAGGERAAAIYSLLGSAKLNGLDPEIYLHHVLERIADHPISRINELLPWNLSLPSQS